jgi:hypothetical protein
MSVPTFAWALEQGVRLGLTSSERLVLLYLADKANGERVCWPGQQTIVRYTALSLRTVRVVIPALEGHGLIAVESAPGIVTRYHILCPVTPVNGTGANGRHPGKRAQGNPGKTAQGTQANEHRAPRQNSTTHPGKSCTEPCAILHATPANQHTEPLVNQEENQEARVPAREPPTGLNAGNLKAAPPPPAAGYEPVEVAREAFQLRLAALRRQAHPEDYPEPDVRVVGPERTKRVAKALAFVVRKKYGPEEKNPPAQQERTAQIVQLTGGVSVARPEPVEPVRTVAEQLAALGVTP